MPLKDAQLDNSMAGLLRTGVSLAALIMLAGGVLYLVRHGAEIPDYRHFHGVPPEMKTIGGIWHGLLTLRAREIIQLGVIAMIATPVLRVAFAVGAFAVERDWLYSGISCIVLAVLAYSLWAA